MIAVISDIHADSDALEAVLERLDSLGVESIVCLGDMMGYGPEPVPCMDAVRSRCDVTVCGNHDFAVIYGANDFSSPAQTSLERHRRSILPRPGVPGDDQERMERWEFLKGLPYRYVRGDWLFVHGSPRNPVIEYLRRMDVRLGMREKFAENFALIEWLAFVGHTHQPGVVTPDMKFLVPQDLDGVYVPQRHHKAIINVGSVGQPRDGDWRACFVTVDDDGTVRYHRVEYDVDRAASKVAEAGGIGGALAERLRRGK